MKAAAAFAEAFERGMSRAQNCPGARFPCLPATNPSATQYVMVTLEVPKAFFINMHSGGYVRHCAKVAFEHWQFYLKLNIPVCQVPLADLEQPVRMLSKLTWVTFDAKVEKVIEPPSAASLALGTAARLAEQLARVSGSPAEAEAA